jgi:hypothetical protein
MLKIDPRLMSPESVWRRSTLASTGSLRARLACLFAVFNKRPGLECTPRMRHKNEGQLRRARQRLGNSGVVPPQA